MKTFWLIQAGKDVDVFCVVFGLSLHSILAGFHVLDFLLQWEDSLPCSSGKFTTWQSVSPA